MIPLRDTIPTQKTPFLNYGLIAGCVGVWLLQVSLSQAGFIRFLYQYGLVPGALLDGQVVVDIQVIGGGGLMPSQLRPVLEDAGLPATILPLFTSMFLHGGWMHLIGNMLFLYIFGDNIEDASGHGRYLLFYLLGGMAGAGAQMAVGPGVLTPMVGASGAIAGVLGAYMVIYPRSQVVTLIPFMFIMLVRIPAVVFLGLWFVFEFISGASSLGQVGGGGVAYWAHVGGFVAGTVTGMLYLIYRPRASKKAPDLLDILGRGRRRRGPWS